MSTSKFVFMVLIGISMNVSAGTSKEGEKPGGVCDLPGESVSSAVTPRPVSTDSVIGTPSPAPAPPPESPGAKSAAGTKK